VSVTPFVPLMMEEITTHTSPFPTHSET
jgi:hypothetical protein